MTCAPRSSAVTFSGVTKAWNGRHVLDAVTYTFREGSTTAILGPSGSGKSTLLNLIAGYVAPDTGTVAAAGRVSYLLQESLLFDTLSAIQNVRVATGASRPGLPETDLAGYLRRVGLAGREHQGVDHLSGGERQRVQFAGLLASEADVILIDEPTASLDRATSRHLAATVGELFSDRTVITVTHDAEFVEHLPGARLLTLRNGCLDG
jgi:ABC-type multidrug transport system ATPase subunit